MRRILLVISLLLGVAAAIGVSACGGDDEQSAATLAPDTQAPTATTPTTTATTPTAPTTTAVPTTAATTTPTTTTPSGGATTTQPSGGAGVTTPTTTQPAGGGGPATCADAVGGFISGVRASGTDCAVAGEVARAWFDAIDGGAAPDAPITAAGFACGGSLAGQVASVSCEGRGGRVTFTASP